VEAEVGCKPKGQKTIAELRKAALLAVQAEIFVFFSLAAPGGSLSNLRATGRRPTPEKVVFPGQTVFFPNEFSKEIHNSPYQIGKRYTIFAIRSRFCRWN